MNPIFETEKYKSAQLKTYTSISSLAVATGLDKKLLRKAKIRNFEGFYSNATVAWNRLKPVLEARYEELLHDNPSDMQSLKEELARKDIRIKELTIRKLERNLLEPEDVKKLLVELATKQSVTLKKELLELPPKLAGKSEVEIKVAIDEALKRIFQVLQQAEDNIDNLANEQ